VDEALAGASRPSGARRVREVRRRAAFAVLAALSGAAHAAGPVAFVADLKGNATIEGDGPVGFLAELTAGTRLLVGSNAFLAVTYAATGAEFTLNGPGEFLVDAAEVRAEKGAAPRRRTVAILPDPGVVARVSRTATASLRMRGIGDGGKARSTLEFPVDTRVSTLQPTLRWKNGARDEKVTVSVVDASGREVWRSGPVPESARTAVKLAPATAYRWTVTTPRGVLGEASFETLPAAGLARVAKSRAAAKAFPDRVMHAVLLQDLGATQEAREAWAALARERPDLPELAALAR
jgi:hypothetical protein